MTKQLFYISHVLVWANAAVDLPPPVAITTQYLQRGLLRESMLPEMKVKVSNSSTVFYSIPADVIEHKECLDAFSATCARWGILAIGDQCFMFQFKIPSPARFARLGLHLCGHLSSILRLARSAFWASLISKLCLGSLSFHVPYLLIASITLYQKSRFSAIGSHKHASERLS